MSFDINSNFNKQANFTGVKFGENKPVLEVELNELQEIQNEARADIIRDSISSGFVKLGEIDYDYCSKNENQIKLKTDSIAYVNGYRINIPNDTIINIEKAPEKDLREDLVILEVWKEEVSKDSDLTVNGGEGQPTIPNIIQDTRYPIETSRRIALKWRIRTISDFDFNAKFEASVFRTLPSTYGGIFGWTDGEIFSKAIAQGGNETVPVIKTNTGKLIFREAKYPWSNTPKYLNEDNSLLVAGLGDDESIEQLKTADGFVYALPMFRLKRRPSVIKGSPFEYNKINPKVDYSKFTALMKEDRVERVISETIKGNSLVNCAYSTSINLTKNLYSPLTHDGIIKSNTEYTLSFNISNITGSATGKILRLILRPTGGSSDTSNDITINVTSSSFTTGKVKVKIPSQTVSIARLYIHLSGGAEGDSIALTEVMILEGDWTNREIPEYFEGIKSLGEDDGNAIILQSCSGSDSIYDPIQGNAKVDTFSGDTHVMSENNIILPNIEAKLQRGDTLISDVTTFGTLKTEGNEIIEFSKIKGKTVQNLATYKSKSNGVIYNSNEDSYDLPYTLENLGGVDYTNLLKPNTKYTLILNVISNTINGSNENSLKIQLGDGANAYSVAKGFTGFIKAVITTSNRVNEGLRILVRTEGATSGSVKYKNFILLEGDYSNTPLDELIGITGIQSVGEQDNKIHLVTKGKNLFDRNNYVMQGCGSFSDVSEDQILNTLGDIKHKWLILKVIPNKTYSITIDKSKTYPVGWANRIMESWSPNVQVGEVYRQLYSISNTNKPMTCTVTPTKPYLYIHCGRAEDLDNNIDHMLDSVQVELANAPTPYEEYKESRQVITVNEPLRSLPNGVCDEIVGNKVIRRVGKVVLNGSETWSNGGMTNDTRQELYITPEKVIPRAKYNNNVITMNYFSDRFPTITNVTALDKWLIVNGLGGISIALPKSELTEPYQTSVTKWLSKNPTTLYYELATPVEEPLVFAHEKESMKSYQLTEPLRRINRDVYDEIIDGVLIRRCGEVFFNGTEPWKEDSVQYYLTNFDTIKHYKINGSCISDKYTFRIGSNYFPLLKKDNNPDITSISDLQSKLQANPVKVIYELNEPIETPLREVKPNSYSIPYHEENTYCGSLYVSNGSNHISSLSGIPSSTPIKAETPYREISNYAKIEDCKYKNNINGYTSISVGSHSANILPINLKSIEVGTSDNVGGVTWEQAKINPVLIDNRIRMVDPIEVKPNTIYTLSNKSGLRPVIKEFNDKGIGVKDTGWLHGTQTFTTTANTRYLVLMFSYVDNSSITLEDVIKAQPMLCEGTSTSYVPYAINTKVIENLEEKDVEDLRGYVSLTGLNHKHITKKSFDKVLKGDL